MDIIEVNCHYYGNDQESSCKCERRRRDFSLFGFKISSKIPPCDEVMSIACGFKLEPPRIPAKKKTTRKKKEGDNA